MSTFPSLGDKTTDGRSTAYLSWTSILGCTEIPLIITPDNSPLPVVDSAHLLAKYAVLEALNERPITIAAGRLFE